MNIVMTNDIGYEKDTLRFFPNVFCTVGTREGSILECQIDIYAHELLLPDGERLYAYKPIEVEIEVDGRIETINAIFTPRYDEEVE